MKGNKGIKPSGWWTTTSSPTSCNRIGMMSIPIMGPWRTLRDALKVREQLIGLGMFPCQQFRF